MGHCWLNWFGSRQKQQSSQPVSSSLSIPLLLVIILISRGKSWQLLQLLHLYNISRLWWWWLSILQILCSTHFIHSTYFMQLKIHAACSDRVQLTCLDVLVKIISKTIMSIIIVNIIIITIITNSTDPCLPTPELSLLSLSLQKPEERRSDKLTIRWSDDNVTTMIRWPPVGQANR